MLDLRKSEKVVLDLTKDAGIEGQRARVILAMDYSGSMEDLYSNRKGKSVVQRIIERLVPIAMAFDDDKEMDFYLFHDGVISLTDKVTVSNLDTYLAKAIQGRSMGGTNYSPVIEAILKDFVKYDVRTTKRSKVVQKPSKSFWGRLFGATISEEVDDSYQTRVIREVDGPTDTPTYVIFITDGENSDRDSTIRSITTASKYPIFFQFVGIKSSPSCRFRFLEELDTMEGRFVDNANFFEITVNDLTSATDEDLYGRLLAEFPDYVHKAKNLNLIS